MRRILFLLLVVLAVSSTLRADEIQPLRPARISDRPHDKAAYTQGLQIVDGELYESTGLYGRSTLRRVDLETGQVLKFIHLPDTDFGEGLTVVGDEIFMLTWREHKLHVFDRETLGHKRTVAYEGEGWGLTYDGKHLIMSDGTPRITFRDPETFDIVSSTTVTLNGNPLRNINELEYVDGYIWANVYQTLTIIKIDPATGKVVAAADIVDFLTPEERQGTDHLNGIAYDAEVNSFWITGKLWPKMFEVVFVPLPPS